MLVRTLRPSAPGPVQASILTAVVGGPCVASKTACQASCHGHATGRCRVSLRAAAATLAGTVMIRRRIVAVVALPCWRWVLSASTVDRSDVVKKDSLTADGEPVEVVTDNAPALARVIDELVTRAFLNIGQYENNRCEAHPGRLESRIRPIRGFKMNRTVSVLVRGHAFVKNPQARPLRTRRRRLTEGPTGDRIRRTPARDLNGTPTANDPARSAIA